MAEAQRLADRVGLLADGDVVAVDQPSALIDQYGGESLLVVEGEFPDGVPDHLDYDTTSADGQLTIRNVDPVDIGRVVQALEEAGIEYDSLTWREPGLDDVYLALAGDHEGVTTDQTAGLATAGGEAGES
jgi:ABC-2 type transport system ATP-binding protein